MGKKLVQAEMNGMEWFVIPTAIAAYSSDGERLQIMLQNGFIMTVNTDDPDEFVKKSLRYRKQYDSEELGTEFDFQYDDIFE